uniref:Uncharacterized protein n=1 Tax=Glossina morsitans morsitans TaxID=37546 RepID=A0A1B0FKA1_GLOMM
MPTYAFLESVYLRVCMHAFTYDWNILDPSSIIPQQDLYSLLFSWLSFVLGWLVAWLPGWLAGWLAGWLGDWVTGWLAGWLAGWHYQHNEVDG